MNIRLIYIFVLIFVAANAAFAQSPDLTITDISRVSGTDQLKITIQNKGGIEAKTGSLKIYALPYGFCITPNSVIIAEASECVKKPFEIPQYQRFTSVASIQLGQLDLAWHITPPKTFAVAAGATIELIVGFPAKLKLSFDAKSKIVYPVPFAYSGGFSNFAPVSLAAFDLSVFYAVVSADNELVKDNNEYFFNIRRRGM